MKIIETKNYKEMSYELFKLYEECVISNPSCCLSFTTGGTPEGMVEFFVDAVNQKCLDISKCTMLNLDEYVGNRNGKYSVYTWMHEHLYNKVKIQPKNKFYIDAGALNQEKEILRYKKILSKHPRDIQMLGLGTNGHIGANEPGSPFDSTMFIANSFESTILATKELFGLSYEETPRQMYTMGYTEIMAAKCVVLAVSGRKKALVLKKLLEEPINNNCPASYLRNHANFILIYDKAAGYLLGK